MGHPRIIVETVPHGQQRYATCGDWTFDEDGCLHVKVSRMADQRYVALVAIHEIVEATLCRNDGISAAAVDLFDLSFTGEGEPGDSPDAPYKRQHLMATAIEKMLCAAMGIDWILYERTVDTL